MNLYLIRHADPDYQHDTITEYGEQQAEKLADWLKDLKVDELYHSSMGRASKTASYLAKKWKLTPIAVDWAREVCWKQNHVGNVDMHSPWGVKDRIIQNTNSYPQGDSWFENPESKDDLFIESYKQHCKDLDAFLAKQGYQRNNQLYKAIEPNEKTVVIVCHGGVISSWISYLTNVPFYHYISHMGVDQTAVTKIQFRGEKGTSDAAQLIYANCQSHLGVK